MKKLRLQTLIVFAILFALVTLSCDENGEESIAQAPTQNSAAIGVRKGASTGRVDDYSFDGSEGDPIPVETANAWIAKYQEQHPGATQAHFFGNEIISQLLTENGAIGIRIYYALDNDGKPQVILFGATANGSDLIPGAELDGEGSNQAADVSYPCPPYCPK